MSRHEACPYVGQGGFAREETMAEQRTGRVNSGDVSLFYRAFGTPGGKTPILILHGSNYYDSYDWIGVASALAGDREVVVPDRRGWGESTWSPSKDYTRDALLDDVLAVTAAVRWNKFILMGHSGAGPVIISFAVNFPDRLEKLVIVDSQMNRDEDATTGPTVGNPPMVFPSIEEAMARFARLNNPPRFGLDRERAEHALIKMANGYMLKRDPDNGNRKPIGEGAQMPARRPVREMWAELAMVKVPSILVRGLQSDRYPPATVERLTKEYPQIPQFTVQSQHDIPRMAPDALIAHVKKFLGAA
jgi:pimeloyl-ACP methyl ester carboxylesterase